MKRTEDKIKEIEKFLGELEDIVPASFEKYKNNLEKKAACERYVEKIVEAMTDLAFLAIKIKKLKIPEDDVDAFNILENSKVIISSLSSKLRNAKGMRNIIAHQYGKIDDEVVYNAIKEDLEEDISKFIRQIRKAI